MYSIQVTLYLKYLVRPPPFCETPPLSVVAALVTQSAHPRSHESTRSHAPCSREIDQRAYNDLRTRIPHVTKWLL